MRRAASQRVPQITNDKLGQPARLRRCGTARVRMGPRQPTEPGIPHTTSPARNTVCVPPRHRPALHSSALADRPRHNPTHTTTTTSSVASGPSGSLSPLATTSPGSSQPLPQPLLPPGGAVLGCYSRRQRRAGIAATAARQQPPPLGVLTRQHGGGGGSAHEGARPVGGGGGGGVGGWEEVGDGRLALGNLFARVGVRALVGHKEPADGHLASRSKGLVGVRPTDSAAGARTCITHARAPHP